MDIIKKLGKLREDVLYGDTEKALERIDEIEKYFKEESE